MKYKLPEFKNTKILVIGDIMLDRYWHGHTGRISPEAPVPVVKVQHMEERPGGAANVALNCASLGAQVTLMGICGDDEAGALLKKTLEAANITANFVVGEHPTITKLRVLSLQQQLIRLDFEEKIKNFDGKQFIDVFAKQLSGVDAVILSDYGKGTLREAQDFIQLAKKQGIPVLVDPKGNDFSHYRGASLITPNRMEYEHIVGICETEQEFITRGQALCQQLELKYLLVTRGAEGMTLLTPGKEEYHLAAHAHEVYDVTGAGDTVIAVLAAAVAAKLSIEEAAYWANLAAGIVVTKAGAASVTPHELRRAQQLEKESNTGIFSEDQIGIMMADAKAHGERIVFTNGCFDILHAGHVHYLEQAKKLGDRLVVAVNSDCSIKALKGEGRPINTLARRMAVLAGLNAVDWVVSFDDDTPCRLLSLLKPDVLVKGGDYTPEQVVGAEIVKEYGGEVQVLGVVEDCSTTAMIEKVKQSQNS